MDSEECLTANCFLVGIAVVDDLCGMKRKFTHLGEEMDGYLYVGDPLQLFTTSENNLLWEGYN